MEEITCELGQLIARRKLEEGEFSYVLRIGGQPIDGKKAVYAKLKEVQPEVFAQFKTKFQNEGEDEQTFDARIMKIVPKVAFEDEVKKEAGMEVDEDAFKDEPTAADMWRVVRVEGMDKKTTNDEMESFFCREFEGVESVKSIGGGKRRAKLPFSVAFNVTFKDDESASTFLAKPELKYQEKLLKAQLFISFIQSKIVNRIYKNAFTNHMRLKGCLPIEAGKEDTYLLAYVSGRPTEEDIQEYFLGLETKIEDVVSAKIVLHCRLNSLGKFIGILVNFENKEALEKFTEQKDLKFKEKPLKFSLMSEVAKTNDVRLRKTNFVVDDGPTTQQLTDRRLIITRASRVRDDNSIDDNIETKIKAFFPTSKDVRYCSVDKLTIVTFQTAEAAVLAQKNMSEDEALGIRAVNVMLLSEYMTMRSKILEDDSDWMEKVKTKWENMKNSCVTTTGNTIKINDPTPLQDKKNQDKKVKKEAVVAPKDAKAGAQQQQPKDLPTNPIMKRRMLRGQNAFDMYVGVRGFNTFIKHMGKASDMDICNYFIYNHKDVADVKFVNWTDVVFAKFKSTAAAERFLGLSYVMFYGIDLALLDVPDFLKKRSDHQKDDLAKILLNKKFNKAMIEGGGAQNAATNGVTKSAATNTAAKQSTPEVELTTFSTKEAGTDIRSLFIDNLHLDEDVVGQPKWMKADKVFKARIPIKLEDNAIGYLVKRWNDLEISVEENNVVMAVSLGSKASVVSGSASKRGRRKPAKAGGKRAKLSLENY